jgi:hypothetical protein
MVFSERYLSWRLISLALLIAICSFELGEVGKVTAAALKKARIAHYMR